VIASPIIGKSPIVPTRTEMFAKEDLLSQSQKIGSLKTSRDRTVSNNVLQFNLQGSDTKQLGRDRSAQATNHYPER